MPYIEPFLRLVASGPLFGLESFSMSMSLIGNGSEATEGGGPDEIPEAIVDAFEAFWLSGAIGNRAVLQVLKLNEIGTDGRYTSKENTVFHDYGGSGIASQTTTPYPPQIALAVTLRTDRSRGRAHAGRFYLPAPAAPMASTDGRIPEAQSLQIAGFVVTLINAINLALPGYSVGVTSDVGTGAQEVVRGVTIGRTLDTIRSRRTSIPEAYPATLPVTL